MKTRTLLAGALGLLSLPLLGRLDAPPSRAQSLDAAVPAAPAVLSANVTITISVYPSKLATVSWGKKKLGVIKPRDVLVVQRPRDSGPLDLIIRSEGFLPVQTRAYTFADTKLAVRLTPLDQQATLLGYREELLPDGGLASAVDPDASVPMF